LAYPRADIPCVDCQTAEPCDQGVADRSVTLLPRREPLRALPLRSLPPESFRRLRGPR
jgi:hypothetical protein